RSLPYADHARRGVSDGGRERDSHRDDDLAGREAVADRLERARGVFERDREDHDASARSRVAVLETLDGRTGYLAAHVRRGRRGGRGALERAGPDHHRAPRRAEAQRETEALVPGAAENGNRPFAHQRISRASDSVYPTQMAETGAAYTPTGIAQRGSRALAIRWSDGAETVLDVRALRLACGCAAGVDEWSGPGGPDPRAVPGGVHPVRVQPVGPYPIH